MNANELDLETLVALASELSFDLVIRKNGRYWSATESADDEKLTVSHATIYEALFHFITNAER
jgi:hypothetical protein